MLLHFLRRSPFIELGNIHVEREFNDVRMVCDAFLKFVQHGVPSETYNVCSGVTFSLGQVLEILTELTAHTLEIRINPGLIQTSEIHTLCGNSKKLESAIGELTDISLRETLAWMQSAPPVSSDRHADTSCL